MKKLLLFAAAAAMFAACSTDTTEDIAVLPDRILRVSFSDDNSRVQLDENSRTVWNEGDLISVFNKTNGNECWQFDGKTSDSVGTISKVSGSAGGSAIGKIFAVYPYAEYNAISADGTITTEIPATQKYCADSYGVGNNIMVASSESGDLAFKNALGWIKIRLSGTETVKSLVLEGNDGETLAGAATVDTDSAVSLAADAAKSLTLYCDEGVALSYDPTAFYFAVVPQVFEKGITVTAHYSDGSTFKKSTDKPIAVGRNHIVPMTKFDATVIPNNQIWYTSTDGKIVVPYATDGFGANIISNTYENEKGVITFDGEIKAIGNWTFRGCHSLASINIPDSVISIGDYAFSYCSSMTRIIIGNNVTSIGDNAFKSCSNMTNITIPKGITSIGKSAFENCSGLTSVAIPNGITSIENRTFYDCHRLTSINIPDGVALIGSHAFCYCSSLANITIPYSVTSIGIDAFKYCSGLISIYCKPTIPPTLGDSAFYNISLSAKIYVPTASVDAYKSASGWSSYASMIEGYDF